MRFPSIVADDAKPIMAAMSEGLVLKVPTEGAPELIVTKRFLQGKPDGYTLPVPPLDRDLITSMSRLGLIHKLTEHGEPPPEQRTRKSGYRLGWRELGIDGTDCDLYVLTQ